MNQLPRRVAIALNEFHQTLARLNEAEIQSPNNTINLARLRMNSKRALEALNYVISHPDMRWVGHSEHTFGPQQKTTIEKGIFPGPNGGKAMMRHHKIPSYERLLARPSEISEAITALRAVKDREGDTKMGEAFRPLLPAHWYIPEVLAFTFHWCRRFEIPDYMVICEGSFPRLDLADTTIYLTLDASSQSKWHSLFTYLDQIRAIKLNEDADKAVNLRAAVKTQDLIEVVQAYLARADWWKPNQDEIYSDTPAPLAIDPNSMLPVFHPQTAVPENSLRDYRQHQSLPNDGRDPSPPDDYEFDR